MEELFATDSHIKSTTQYDIQQPFLTFFRNTNKEEEEGGGETLAEL